MPSWLRKHRDERDQIQFVELGWFETLEELKAAEIEFIRQGRLRGECDLNLTDGGEGGNGWKHTEESKRKLSAAFSGSKNPMYGRDRRELMLYASGFRGPVTQAMKENLSRKMVAWWDDRPERRLEYSQRVSEAWKSGRMTAATRETSIEAVKARDTTLSDSQVSLIRQLRSEGGTLKGIATTTGVPVHQVRSALGHRGSYDWSGGPAKDLDWRVLRLSRLGMVVDDIRTIRRLSDGGAPYQDIKERYPQLDRAQILHITSRRGYKWVSENREEQNDTD